MNIWVGTSGYSYKQWKGSFYPPKCPDKEMLSRYAQRLPSVEINNTFYRLPKESVLESWAQQVPESFQFAIKASRRITHLKRLKDVNNEMEYLFNVLGSLGQRLGGVLFQLPPNLKLDLGRLEAFLNLVPKAARAAIEFRHESWFVDEVFSLLRKRNAALVISQDDQSCPPLVHTSDWGYLRLRKDEYSVEDLQNWAHQIRTFSWSDAYVYFKHEDAGVGPRLAGELAAMLGEA